MFKLPRSCCSGTEQRAARASQCRPQQALVSPHRKACPVGRNPAGFPYLVLHQNRKSLAKSNYDNKDNFSGIVPLLQAWVTVSYVTFLSENSGARAPEDSAATGTRKPQLFSTKWLQRNTAATTEIHYYADKALRSAEPRSALIQPHSISNIIPFIFLACAFNKHLGTRCLPEVQQQQDFGVHREISNPGLSTGKVQPAAVNPSPWWSYCCLSHATQPLQPLPSPPGLYPFACCFTPAAEAEERVTSSCQSS